MNEKIKNHSAKIAWQGWCMPIEDDWHLLKIEGNHREGAVFIGYPEIPLLEIKWKRLKNPYHAEAKDWLMQIFNTSKYDKNPPCPQSFSSSAWIFKHKVKNDNYLNIWIAIGKDQKTIIELITTNNTPDYVQKKIFHKLLDEIVLYTENQNWFWAINNISFSIPARFTLRDKHLFCGDIGLLFDSSERETLTVRQIYPAKLALSRKDMKSWLLNYPFHQKRKTVIKKEETWNDKQSNLQGIRLKATKKIAFPLGWLDPFSSDIIIAHDQKHDKLLAADYSIAKKNQDINLCTKIILEMNK